MEVYTTENEQVDAVRRFFAENGKALAVGVVLGIGALVGWRYWQNQQISAIAESSAIYQQATEALAANQPDSVALTEKFVQGSNSNAYSALAAMQLAQHFVEQGDNAKAEQQLLLAQGKSSDVNLSALINLRLARVQLDAKKVDEALKTLDKVTDAGWMAMAQDVRGDVLVAKSDLKGAREAYSKGLESNAPQALQNMLRMKLNNLAS